MKFIYTSLLVLVATLGLAEGPNVLENGDFSRQSEGGTPAEWSIGAGQKGYVDRERAPSGLGQALRVELVRDEGGFVRGNISEC